jgi:hypothetical protein
MTETGRPDPATLLSPQAIERRRNVVRAASRSTLRRRSLFGTGTRVACYVALVIALIPLVALIAYTIKRGVQGLSVSLFTQLPVPQGVPGGGVYNAIIGTLMHPDHCGAGRADRDTGRIGGGPVPH